jgi:hypothetical protein
MSDACGEELRTRACARHRRRRPPGLGARRERPARPSPGGRARRARDPPLLRHPQRHGRKPRRRLRQRGVAPGRRADARPRPRGSPPGSGRRQRRARGPRQLGVHLGSLAGDLDRGRRSLRARPAAVRAAPQRPLRVRRARVPLLRALPGRAASPAPPRAGRHRHRAVARIPGAPAAGADQPVRGVPEPARGLEPARRGRRVRGDDEPRRARVRRRLAAGDGVRRRRDREPLRRRRGGGRRGGPRRARRRTRDPAARNGGYTRRR